MRTAPRAARRQRTPLAAALLAAAGAAAAAAAPPALLATLEPQAAVAAQSADGWKLGAGLADFQAADAVPVRDIEADAWPDYAPRAGRNLALRSARAELTAERGPWAVSAFARAEVLIDGSRGAWDVAHAYRQRRAPADGTGWQVDGEGTGLVRAGLRVAHTWAPSRDWRLAAALSAVSLRAWRRDEAIGTVGYDAATGWRITATTERENSRRAFADGAQPPVPGAWGKPGTRGRGVALDLGLRWQPAPLAFASVSVVDAFTRLKMPGVPSETAVADSATQSVDAEGFLAYRPLLQGRYASTEVRPRPPRQWVLQAGWPVGTGVARGQAGLRWEQAGPTRLAAPWLRWPLHGVLDPDGREGIALALDAETRFRTLGIGLEARRGAWRGELMLRTRSLPLSSTHALGWQARLAWSL